MKVRLMLLLTLSLFLLFARGNFVLAEEPEKVKQAEEEIEKTAQEKGKKASDVEQATKALSELVEKGVPVEHALGVVKIALTLQNYDGEDVAKIARSLGETVEKSGHAKEISKIAKVCIKKNLKSEDVEKVMSTVSEAIDKDVSPRQLRILSEDLLDKDANVDGLTTAIEAVSKSVEAGFSPEESRKTVALIALKGLRDGLRGQELAAEIRKEAKRHLPEKALREREKAREHMERRVPEDVKDYLKEREEMRKPEEYHPGRP